MIHSKQQLVSASSNYKMSLQDLRSLMKDVRFVEKPLQGYIIASTDAHQTDYVADCDKRIEFLSGFTGSPATATVTIDHAVLWTDGRYSIQAARELRPGWKMMNTSSCRISQSDWFKMVLPPQSRVGFDPLLMTYSSWQTLSTQLALVKHTLVPVMRNLVDLIWKNRPDIPRNPIYPLSTQYTGLAWREKVAKVRTKLANNRAIALLVTALDEIAYLLNLRGSDTEFIPIFTSYAIVTLSSVYLFVDEEKVTVESKNHLDVNSKTVVGVRILPYQMIGDFLREFTRTNETGKIWVCNKSSYALVSLIPQNRFIMQRSPLVLAKAIKNPVEINCMKKSNLKDSIVFCELISWLEEAIGSSQLITEVMVTEKLEQLRQFQYGYVCPSFRTISASGPNGAEIHYSLTEETCRFLGKHELYLLDAGGQYVDGTTDITRTMHFGVPNQKEKEFYTRVVKGHIAFASRKFNAHMDLSSLDYVARKPLKDVGRDYPHATSHGIGMFLCVHEELPSALQEGMILSIEPGCYEAEKFGIRIENIALVTRVDSGTDQGKRVSELLCLELLTFVPLQSKLLDTSLLTSGEIDWINRYHEKCRRVISPELITPSALKWLIRQTQPIGKQK